MRPSKPCRHSTRAKKKAKKRARKRRGGRQQTEQRSLFAGENHGGARPGAGRKAKRRADGKRVHASHDRREKVVKSRPLHVTVNFVEGLPSLRGEGLAEAILEALEARPRGDGFRVVHFSLQSNHLHLICEAHDNAALTSGMRGLGVRIARAVNRFLGRTGRVIAERFHLHVLRTMQEVRNAVRYVLQNAARHGSWRCRPREEGGPPRPDPLSSAAWFLHWTERTQELSPRQARASVIDEAQTWLMRMAFEGGAERPVQQPGRPAEQGPDLRRIE